MPSALAVFKVMINSKSFAILYRNVTGFRAFQYLVYGRRRLLKHERKIRSVVRKATVIHELYLPIHAGQSVFCRKFCDPLVVDGGHRA